MFQQEEPELIGDILQTLAQPAEVLPEVEARKQEQENLTKGLSLWKASGVSERHKNFKPEQSLIPEWTAQWEKLKKELDTGVIAVIIGTRGAGKTQMAVCAIRVMCKKLKASKYVKAMSFFLDVRRSYSKGAEKTEHEVIAEFLAPALLVIDAIENRSDTPFENLLLNYLIDLRYDGMKDTILIGNLTEADFAASMGVSIVDRIHECGVKIVCNWTSFRRL